jgi:hypothetical protein
MHIHRSDLEVGARGGSTSPNAWDEMVGMLVSEGVVSSYSGFPDVQAS